MDILFRVGPFGFPKIIVILLITYIISFILLKVLFKLERVELKTIFDKYINIGLIYFLGWKLTPFLLNIRSNNLLSTLYIPGGNKGIIIGAIASLIYILLIFIKIRFDKNYISKFIKYLSVILVLFLIIGSLFTFLIPNEENQLEQELIVYNKSNIEIKIPAETQEPIILNFWASWCPPCRAEMGDFIEVISENEESNIYLINIRPTESNPDSAIEFLNSIDSTIPFYWDNGDLANYFNIETLPTTVVIDGDYWTSHSGAVDKSWIERKIFK